MKTYKGLPKKLNVISEREVNGITYILVNGYKDSQKVVGYSNTNVINRGFISYTNTQFKNIQAANDWINSK